MCSQVTGVCKAAEMEKTRRNPFYYEGNPFVKKLKSIHVPLNLVFDETSSTQSRTHLTGSHEHTVISSSLSWKAAAATVGRSARSMHVNNGQPGSSVRKPTVCVPVFFVVF